jgi:hypothetical protein
MTFSDKDINTFQALYAKRFGVEIDKQEAIKMGNRLLDLFRPVLKPLPGNKSIEFNQTKICQKKKQQKI